MRCTRSKLSSRWPLYMMVVMMLAISLAGCGRGDAGGSKEETQSQGTEETEAKEIGEGAKQFLFEVVEEDGRKTTFQVHTNKTMVGEALLEVGLIEGVTETYGLYVKKVNGILADYDVNKRYWAFYADGKYAVSGVDTTEIEEGVVYSFRVEK